MAELVDAHAFGGVSTGVGVRLPFGTKLFKSKSLRYLWFSGFLVHHHKPEPKQQREGFPGSSPSRRVAPKDRDEYNKRLCLIRVLRRKVRRNHHLFNDPI